MGFAHPGAVPALPDGIEALAWQARSRQPARSSGGSSGRPGRSGAPGRSPPPSEAAGSWRSRAALLESGAAGFRRLGFLPDAARAELLLGRALLRAGRRTAAAEALSTSLERFSAMGAVLWEARAAEELERVPPGRVAGELTPTEKRVAGLVAKGLKNREIAETLFLSVATVEAHLTRIYRKLDIRSRSELARLVAEGAVPVSAGRARPEGPPQDV
jgi:DNA-binding CsgD family transcriptional regulator